MREDLTALRYITNPEARPRLGRQAAKIVAVEDNLPRGRRQQPHQAFEQRGLAHAVAAHDASARSGRHRQIHVPQRVAAAVRLIEAADLEQAHAPKYTSMTRGSAWTWSMVPSASTRPSCRTVTRPAIDRTKSMSCSTTTTECDPARPSSRSAVRSVSRAVM